jgi:UDP-N-acetylmuramoylalanine--D-glutamate ligase
LDYRRVAGHFHHYHLEIEMIEVKGKHITVLGAARSGVGAALMLKDRGAQVFVSDSSEIAVTSKERLQAAGIDFEEKGHSDRARKADYVAISPGVPSDCPIVIEFISRNIPVLSELEWASQYLDGKITAITGSNGKTTTTSWVDDIWKKAGRTHVTAGNIGTALSEHIYTGIPSWTDVILEVSSFQLDHIQSFRPKVSMLLNITPDHLNRYQYTFENYIAAKFRIFENQGPDDIFIYWADDPVIRAHIAPFIRPDGPQIWTFSTETAVSRGAWIQDNHLMITLNGKTDLLMPIDEISLKGRHNLHNSMAAALAARANEISDEVIRESLSQFEGVEHRLELVRVLDGVRYINDSKATNVNALWYALDSIHTPMVVIMGGRDKGNDYSELFGQIREKVHTIIAIGEGKQAIKDQLGGVVINLIEADSMVDAVRAARKVSRRGEVVLLSPACASFDMFENYEHRGREFKKAVHNL